MVDFSKLPIELINIIINYTDVVVYRNGKYLNRIQKNDKRYDVVKQRQLPVWVGPNRRIFYFRFYNNIDKRILSMEHTYNPNNKRHFLSKREIIKHDDGSLIVRDQIDYIFDLQGECREVVDYTM
jgi:hypothetical protein